MQLSSPCINCGTSESHGFKSTSAGIVCASCTRVSISSVSYNTYSYKKEREKYAKDIVQPFIYKRGKSEMNPDFKKLYPKEAKEIEQNKDAGVVTPPVKKWSEAKADAKKAAASLVE